MSQHTSYYMTKHPNLYLVIVVLLLFIGIMYGHFSGSRNYEYIFIYFTIYFSSSIIIREFLCKIKVCQNYISLIFWPTLTFRKYHFDEIELTDDKIYLYRDGKRVFLFKIVKDEYYHLFKSKISK